MNNYTSFFLLAEHHNKSEKVSYAKRMAQGYLRSMGMGEWTPKVSASDTAKSKQASSATSTTKQQAESGIAAVPKSRNNVTDDDQDFDF